MKQSHETLCEHLTETRINYSSSVITGTVQWLQPHPDTGTGRANSCIFIASTTNFHPVDYQWPDQPGDRGFVTFQDAKLNINDCYVAAFNPETKEFFLDTEIPIKRGEAGWIFCVAHCLASPFDKLLFNIGDEVSLQIDNAYRHSLNVAHSGCHLMSLALNRCLESYWNKPVILDAMSAPDFDRLAIEQSRISPFQSRDQYRIGKSIRKKGLNKAALLENIENLQTAVNLQLQHWLASPQEILTSQEGNSLLSRKSWQTTLDQQPVIIPCGGTHCNNLSQLETLRVVLDIDDSGNALTVTTTLSPIEAQP